ncbi:MAG TPA: hypothetical protein VMM13_11565 [Euzebya sp.]|nr:hypothetical protein [Euzebya sp.]
MIGNAVVAETWEVRVHGVAGTSAASMLELAPIQAVGATSGLEHLTLTGMPRQIPTRWALSWSSLTSGTALHAFYVLLLPFMLSNVAGWMMPDVQVGQDRSGHLRRRLVLMRLVACLVTIQFGTLMTLTAVDIIGRQAVAGRVPSDWQPVAAVAGVLLCGLITAALAWLTRVRPRAAPPIAGADPDDPVARHKPLIDPVGTVNLVTDQHALWSTPVLVQALHHAHVALLLGTIATLVAASTCRPRGCGTDLSAIGTDAGLGWGAVGVGAVGVLVSMTALVAVIATSWSRSGMVGVWVRPAVRVGRWVGAAALVAAAWVWADSPGATADTLLHHAGVVSVITVIVYLVSLAGLAAAGWWMAATLMSLAAGVGALFGAGMANTVRTLLEDVEMPELFGWLALLFVTVGVALVVVATGRYVWLYLTIPPTWSRPMVVLRHVVQRPRPVVAAIGGIGVLGALGMTLLYMRYGTVEGVVQPVDTLPGAEDVAWTLFAVGLGCLGAIAVIATRGVPRAVGLVAVPLAVVVTWLRWSTDSGGMAQGGVWQRVTSLDPWWIVALAVVGAALVLLLAWLVAETSGIAFVVAVVGAGIAVRWMQTTTQTGEDVLVAVALTLPVGLVLTRLRGAVKDPDARKGLAVVWDVGTFWPRWFHPFSPPTYSDTAVTEVSTLLQTQLPARPILLAPHSQGSVIAAAAILHAQQAMQATPAPSMAGKRRPDLTSLDRLALLTHGSPLRRHYRMLFPAMFSTQALQQLADLLTGQEGLRWRNLHRMSDPIGSAIGEELGRVIDRGGDRGLWDPAGRGHSGYWLEVEWTQAVTALTTLIQPATPP